MFNKPILVFCFFCVHLCYGKTDTIYQKYYYPNQQISSEGTLLDGKPNGYWKTYFETGEIKSEGNREQFLLEGNWKFYRKNKCLSHNINYHKGQKKGLTKTYSKSCNLISIENYQNNIKQGKAIHYFDKKDTNLIQKEVYYKDGKLNGLAYEYDTTNSIITINTYEKGNLLKTKEINRKNDLNQKENEWLVFYDDTLQNKKIKIECRYKNDLLNGYYKTYDNKGQLINAVLYIDGKVKKNIEEELLKTEKKYDKNGVLISEGSYDVLGNKNGKFTYFGANKKIIKTEIYKYGSLKEKGLIDEEGFKQGDWIYYINDSIIESKGKYKDGKKIEKWEYYFKDGTMRQIGKYISEERPHGSWKWYHKNGKLLREENFFNGKEEGLMEEYTSSGMLITKGEYSEGEKEGKWFYEVGDEREEGNYKEGNKDGIWKHYNGDILIFEGKYIDGLPEGKHKYYYLSKKIKKETFFILGIKEKTWKDYNELGEIELITLYDNGNIIKINGIKVK